jgi:YebC/PmpR family DNA-binding regulatory protein
LRYEGFGPGGTAFMVEAVTDNRQRTAADIRHIFEKRGGSLASSGAVSWMFRQKGLLIVERNSVGEDDLLEIALEVGAEDIQTFDDVYEIYCNPQEFDSVKKGLESKGLKLTASELSWIAKDPVTLDEAQLQKVLAFLEALEEHEDVQTVYGNFEIAEQSAAPKQDSVAQCHR